MATTTDKASCVICGKGKATLKCTGCSQHFCYDHVADHRQELNQQLDEVEVSRDVFRQILTDQTTNPDNHPFIKQIDEWERESIHKIQQTAEEAKQLVFQHMIEHTAQIESRFNKLTDQLRQSRQENDFFETDLTQWKEELKRLTEEFNKPSNIKLQEDFTPLVNRISVSMIPITTSSKCNRLSALSRSTILNCIPGTLSSTEVNTNTRWMKNGVTVAGGHGEGTDWNYLHHPHGICMDFDQKMYIADYKNNRIVAWKSGELCGQVVAGGNGKGDRIDQLHGPIDVVIDKENKFLIISDQLNRRVLRRSLQNRVHKETIISDIDCAGITMDHNGYLYVSDFKKNEVRRYTMGDTCETIVAGGNGNGNRVDQLSSPTYLFVDHECSVYVSDSENHRVMKWISGAKEGVVVAGSHGKGSGLAQLSHPGGMTVDLVGNVYVVDDENDRVMRWSKGATQGNIVVGGNRKGRSENQLDSPGGLSFDQQGNLYVVDWGNHRVQRFDIDPSSSF